MTVGERIEQKRKENNLSMEALGDLLGVGKSAINKWEKGYVQRISRPMIMKMAKIFECDPAWLGGYTENEINYDSKIDNDCDLRKEKMIQAIIDNFPDEILDDPDTATQIMQIIDVACKINPDARLHLIQTLESLIS